MPSFTQAELIAEFYECYPMFVDCSEYVPGVYKQVQALHGHFCGIKPESRQKQAIMLAMAHYLTLQTDPVFLGGQVKSIKNRNDQINYANADSDDSYSFTSTIYGSMLSRLLRNYSAIGFTSNQGYYYGRGYH